MSSIADSSSVNVPGWEEALRELVQADVEYVSEGLVEASTNCLTKIQSALQRIQKILGTVAHALMVPEDIGKSILSLTEGWENFWVDYDLLSAVHSSCSLAGHNILTFDVEGRDTLDVLDATLDLRSLPESVRSLAMARKRLLRAVSHDQARLILICARITAVDILLRQPKKSSMFLSSYFQSFPSFICQVASVGNLMASRAVSETSSSPVSASSIESMIAFASMSLLSTVIAETNHVTQALSVLSANNPHSGILANLINLTLSPAALMKGAETSAISKASIYVLMSAIQNAKHPSSVANATMMRRMLEVLVDSESDPEVTHACCVCLEVALEFSHTSFTILFRDLEALDKLINKAVRLSDSPLLAETSVGKALSSIFSLLRFSFQAQEIHVGINLHEKLSSQDSPLRRLFVQVITLGSSSGVAGYSVLNACLTLLGNIMADDPTIISTFASCGIVEALANSANSFNGKRSSDVVSSLFVSLCAVNLHESGSKKLSEFGDTLGQFLQGITSDKFECSVSSSSAAGSIASNDEHRILEDVGIVAGQSCDDLLRNKPAMKDRLMEAAVIGLQTLTTSYAANSGESENGIDFSKRIIPGLRVLYGGLLSSTELVESFIAHKGVSALTAMLGNQSLENGALLLHTGNRPHPIASVFKSIAQRCGRNNVQSWQEPLALEMQSIIQKSSNALGEKEFSRIATVCLLVNTACSANQSSTSMGENSSGALIFLAECVSHRLLEIHKIYSELKEKNCQWSSAAWTAVRNFVSILARISNSLLPNSSEITATGKALSLLLVSGVVKFAESCETPEDLSELVDLLNRIMIEDKNHSIRPVSVYAFWALQGVESVSELFKKAVLSGIPKSNRTNWFESFLIFFERITSQKRLVNSPSTRALEKDASWPFSVYSLSGSVTCKIAEIILSLQESFVLLDEQLSSTSATAIIKIYSHAVMLADEGAEPAPAPVSLEKRTTTRTKKRARKLSSSESSPDANFFIALAGSEIHDILWTIVPKQFGEIGESIEFTPRKKLLSLSRAVADVFVTNCFKIGDKGGCESAVAELLQRHMDYLGVSIVPSNPNPNRKKSVVSNREYISEIATAECILGKSRSACAMLGSALSSDLVKNSGSAKIVLEETIGIVLSASNSDEERVSILCDPHDYIGPVLALINQLLDACIFTGGISLELQQELLNRVLDFFESLKHESVASSCAQAVTLSGLAVLSSLARRRENVGFVLARSNTLLAIPNKARFLNLAPLLTEVLLTCLNSDLSVAVKLAKNIDAFVESDRAHPVSQLLENPIILETAVREPRVLQAMLKQVMERRKNEGGDWEVERKEDKIFDCSTFQDNQSDIDSILTQLVGFILSAATQVDKSTGLGIGDLLLVPNTSSTTTEGVHLYPYAISLESALIMMTAILGEVGLIREMDDRLNLVQEKILLQLVSQVGRLLVEELSQILEDSRNKVAVASNIFKLMKVWADGINRCSPWLSKEVLRMVKSELEVHATESESHASVLRSYSYALLVYLLVDSVDLDLEVIEELVPVLGARLKRAATPSSLCRFDTHFQIEALYASLYSLASRAREAAVRFHQTVKNSESEEEQDEGEDADAEMTDTDNEEEEEEEDDDIDDDDDDEDQEEDDDDVDVDMEEDGELPILVQPSDDEESSDDEMGDIDNDEGDEESDSDGDDEEYFGDGFSVYDDYDVDWEEDDDDDEDDNDDDEEGEGDEDVDRDSGIVIDGGIEIANYMMDYASRDSGPGPAGSPLAGPEPVSPSPSANVSSGPNFNEETLEHAKNVIRKLLTEDLPEGSPKEPQEDAGEDQEEKAGETGEEEGSSEEESSKNGSDLLNMTEEEQLAGLSELSPEERLSIQQALGMDNDEDDYFDSEELGGNDEEDDEDEINAFISEMGSNNSNLRVSHGPLPPLPPGVQQLRMMFEVPRDMDATTQANLVSETLESLGWPAATGSSTPPMFTTNRSSSKKQRGEFSFDDEVPRQEQAEKLSSDSPQFGNKQVAKLSDCIASALMEVGSVSSRTLMLRNQVPLKPVLDRFFVHLCLDPRSRSVVLENLFSSALRFLCPNSPWTLPGQADDSSMPPYLGVYDSGFHALLARENRVIDMNGPGQCRSVGSGRLINALKHIVEHVPRSRLWFSQAVISEARLAGEMTCNFLSFSDRKTPEKISRRKSSVGSTPQEKEKANTSSDGEGPLVRCTLSQNMNLNLNNYSIRKINPVSVCIKLLNTPFVLNSPSHSLILISLVLEVLTPFPSSSSDSSECDSVVRQAVPEEAIQLLCESLVEHKARLRHMPEFDKTLDKVTQVLVSLCKDVKVRELVRQRLLSTGSRLVSEMLNTTKDSLSLSAVVPLVRLFRTAKQAFGTKRVEAGEPESFLDFAPSISDISQVWAAIDLRLAAHNNLLLGAPSVAQQALQRSEERRQSSSSLNQSSGESSASPADSEKPSNKIAALETISKLIPLVELFLSAHDVSAVYHKGKRVSSSQVESSEAEKAASSAVMDFVERHRRPINAMVKSRPSILNKAFAPIVEICPHMLDFDNKRAFFRTKLRQQIDDSPKQVPSQLKITVRRDDVFRDSYAKLQIRTKEEWRSKLNITFQGEEGVDAGGLVREWFSILAREIFNPNYALFTRAYGRPSTFLINPASHVNPDHIHYFKFCGRFIGKAVFDNQRIDAYFVRSFYKHMLGKEVTWRDMETTDPDYFKNLNWILENDMTDVDYYSFTVEENEFGKLKVVELIPDGENIRVTELNKQEYVQLVCEHKLMKGIQDQLKAFLQGFHELIPENLVGSLFDDKELEMLISGLPTIDVQDLKQNTDYVHYSSDSEEIKWFWKALEKFSPDELAWFLQFVTGSTQVPLEGFKGLAGMNGPQRFSIHRIQGQDRLPTAHTCFNQLDLPVYSSYETLESKLKQAVREGHSGFGFI